MAPASLTGLILAGGQARRMQAGAAGAGGHEHPVQMHGLHAGMQLHRMGPAVDKGLLDLRGEPLVAHARRFLAPHVGSLLISANRHEQLYARYGEVVADDPALGSGLGPLAGVERALALMQTPWLLVLPVDVVNLPAGLVGQLMGAVHAEDAPIAYAITPERAHPLCMALHAGLAQSLRAYLLAGDRKVQLWQDRHHAVPVVFEGTDLFFNINTPDDLRYASQCGKS